MANERGSGGGTPGKDMQVQIVLVSDGLQWSKTIRVTKDMTGKDLLSSVRERVKAEGVKIPPVELQNLSLHLPAAAGTWIEEKKKLGKYKLADGAVIELKVNAKESGDKPRKDSAPSADMKDDRHICALEFPEASFRQSVQVDLATKVTDLIAIAVKAHAVDAAENFALTTILDGARVVLANEATLGTVLGKKGEKALRKLELLAYERVFNKLAFVIAEREVSLRLPVQSSAREAIASIFEKFGEDVKKAEHFALVMCPRSAVRMVGLLLESNDIVGTYKLRNKDARFHLKYHRKDIADLQLQRIKLDALKTAFKNEIWITVESKDGNVNRATVLIDGEVTVGETITALMEHLGITGASDLISLMRGKTPLERTSKLGGFGLVFGDKLVLKRKEEKKEKDPEANTPASPPQPPQPKVAPAMYKKSDNPADGVFGVDPATLELVDDAGYRIPAVLRQLRECLTKHGGLSTVGIFRVEGHNLKMKQFQADLNAHKIVDMSDHVHEASSLIKRYYDDLPGKLLGSIPDDVLDQASSLEGALTIAEKLPRMQRDLFNWLVSLLAQVAANKDVNKMDSSNLGIVFGPLLALSRNPIHALVQTGKVVQLVALNIQHPPVLLASPSSRSRTPTDATQPAAQSEEEALLSPEQLKQLEQLEKLQSDRPELFAPKKQRGAIRAMDITSLMADQRSLEEEIRRAHDAEASNAPSATPSALSTMRSTGDDSTHTPAAAVGAMAAEGHGDADSKSEEEPVEVDSDAEIAEIERREAERNALKAKEEAEKKDDAEKEKEAEKKEAEKKEAEKVEKKDRDKQEKPSTNGVSDDDSSSEKERGTPMKTPPKVEVSSPPKEKKDDAVPKSNSGSGVRKGGSRIGDRKVDREDSGKQREIKDLTDSKSPEGGRSSSGTKSAQRVNLVPKTVPKAQARISESNSRTSPARRPSSGSATAATSSPSTAPRASPMRSPPAPSSPASSSPAPPSSPLLTPLSSNSSSHRRDTSPRRPAESPEPRSEPHRHVGQRKASSMKKGDFRAAREAKERKDKEKEKEERSEHKSERKEKSDKEAKDKGERERDRERDRDPDRREKKEKSKSDR